MPREVSAGAIVYLSEGESPEYLLLHYEAGHWDFPKGNIEEGEEELETVRREIREETGIEDLIFVEGFRRSIRYFYKRRGGVVLKEVIFYLARSHTKEVRLSYEHKGYVWLNFKEALDRLTFKNSRNLLEAAQEHLSKHPELLSPSQHSATCGSNPSTASPGE
jgi:8-oxo-dGTP pyrophosphatase MutT (NUDIX family)